MKSLSEIETLLDTLTDPEIPVLTLRDLGILREVRMSDTGEVEVLITPTYSGCPAMDAIALDIRLTLQAAGVPRVAVTHVLQPAWTTDWMSDAGKEKLRAYGIAPPVHLTTDTHKRMDRLLFEADPQVPCPHCGSDDTECVSAFGSTACKSLYRCLSCKEPFDYFKCH